jgi:signal transduction histidine kinase
MFLCSVATSLIVYPVSEVVIDPKSGFLLYEYTSYYPLTIAYPAIAILASIFLLSIDGRRLRSKQRVVARLIRPTLVYVLAILLVSYFIPVFIFDNLLLEYSSFNVVTLAYLIFIGQTLFYEKLVDLRKNSWRIVIRYSLLAVVIVLFVAMYGRVLELLGLANTTYYFVDLVENIILVVLAALVARGTAKALDVFFQRYQLDIQNLSKSLEALRSTLDIGELAVKYVDTLVSVFKPSDVKIVLYQHTTNELSLVEHSQGKTDFKKIESDKEFTAESKEIASFLKDREEINEGETQVTTFTREQLVALGTKGFYSGYIISTGEVTSLVFMGEKSDGQEYTDNEISLMSTSINDFVLIFQNALQFEKIKAFNLTLQKKVDDATRSLKRANQKLKDLDEAKDEFISMASHQLRTPLTSMKGYVSMVLEGDAGKVSDMQRKLLDQAFVSSQRMVYLIADLLNVSRLKTGKFIIEAKPTNLARVVEEEISQLVETAKGRNLELTYDKPKDFPELMLDETKVRQVVMNFTDNAIYYTPAGGHIHVHVEDKGQSVEVRVTDDGLGVPKSEQHKLFGKFFRAGNARKARPDGTGLGLFMAKKVVVAQGGSIIFKSQEGKGSTFGFNFAKSKLHPPTES